MDWFFAGLIAYFAAAGGAFAFLVVYEQGLDRPAREQALRRGLLVGLLTAGCCVLLAVGLTFLLAR